MSAARKRMPRTFPTCTRQCVVVVGGENGDEDEHWRWENSNSNPTNFQPSTVPYFAFGGLVRGRVHCLFGSAVQHGPGL